MCDVIDISHRTAANGAEQREKTGAVTLFIHVKNATLIAHYAGKSPAMVPAEELLNRT